jgi:Ca2+-binding EF-hand superfamily protein
MENLEFILADPK